LLINNSALIYRLLRVVLPYNSQKPTPRVLKTLKKPSKPKISAKIQKIQKPTTPPISQPEETPALNNVEDIDDLFQ
jgi:hypothetical protein